MFLFPKGGEIHCNTRTVRKHSSPCLWDVPPVCREGTTHTTTSKCQLPTTTEKNEFTLSKIFCVLDQLSDFSLVEGILLKSARDEESKDEIVPPSSSYRRHSPFLMLSGIPSLALNSICLWYASKAAGIPGIKKKKGGNNSYL